MEKIKTDQIFEDIVETIREPLLVLDSDLKVILANQNFYKFFKVKPEETVGQLIYDLGNKQWDIPKLRELLEEILPKNNSFDNYKVEHDFATIGRRVMLLNARQIEQAMGKERIILLAIEDITERKQAEEAHKKEKIFSEKIVETANAIIVGLDKNHIIRIFNRGAEKITGYKKEEVIGKDWFKIFFPEKILDEMNKVWKNAWGVKSHSYINPILAKSGEEKFISWQTTGMYDSNDVSMHLVLSIGEDITERKQAEEKIIQQNEFLNNVMESLTHPFYVIDVNDCSIIQGNKASGFSAGSNKISCHALTHNSAVPCNRQDSPCPLEITKKTRQPAMVEQIHFDEAGNNKNVEVYCYPVFDKNGAISSAIEYSLDITERKQWMKQQKELLRIDKMISLGILLSEVAHEINNPNNTILLNSQFLDDAWDDILGILSNKYTENGNLAIGSVPYGVFETKGAKLLSSIVNSSRRIKSIVDELKNYVRNDPSREMKKININSVIGSAVNLMDSFIKNCTNNFKLKRSENLPFMFGDFQKLEQVIINIIQNSCQALQSRNDLISISTSYVPNSNQIKVIITDTGTGIKKEHLSHVTEPFFTLKQDSGGTGLGLSISQKIIRDHKGQMIIRSEKNKGTNVILLFQINEIKQYEK